MPKARPQSQILKILGRKKAVSKADFEAESESPKERYAISRTVRNMVNSGLVEALSSEQSEFLRITPLGRQKLYSDELGNTTLPLSGEWDGKWRIMILDISEDRKSEREALRYLLKKAGFLCLKNSVWISPLPFEQFFANIKKDLGLSTELMIIVTQYIDEETQKELFKIFGK